VCFLVSCCGILGMGTHFNTSDVSWALASMGSVLDASTAAHTAT
jgi:hypothetical protein